MCLKTSKMFNIRRDVTSDRMASTAGFVEPLALKHWITAAQTHTVTRRPQMTPVLSNALLTNDALTKYIIIPGSLLAGGCLLFCSGYLFGSRKARRYERSSPFEKCDAKQEIQISCFAAERELPRVNSGTSLISTLSFDEVSERGSPGGNGGDIYRCALIVRKDCGLVPVPSSLHDVTAVKFMCASLGTRKGHYTLLSCISSGIQETLQAEGPRPQRMGKVFLIDGQQDSGGDSESRSAMA